MAPHLPREDAGSISDPPYRGKAPTGAVGIAGDDAQDSERLRWKASVEGGGLRSAGPCPCCGAHVHRARRLLDGGSSCSVWVPLVIRDEHSNGAACPGPPRRLSGGRHRASARMGIEHLPRLAGRATAAALDQLSQSAVGIADRCTQAIAQLDELWRTPFRAALLKCL